MPQEGLRRLLRHDVIHAAQALVGSILVRGNLKARIVETEAYRAEDDPACHAYRSRTIRNETMWGEPGHAYVYLNYGIHWMLNISCHEPGRAAAVLVRAAEPIEGLEEFRLARPGIADNDLLRGPGKLCKTFGITRADDGMDLLDPSSEMRLLAAEEEVPLVVGPRIGLAIGKGDDLPWRFADAARLPWVSKPVPPKYR
jgi:DNA-3-methyladenine glycosylase